MERKNEDIILTNSIAVITDLVNRESEWADGSTSDVLEAWNVIKEHLFISEI